MKNMKRIIKIMNREQVWQSRTHTAKKIHTQVLNNKRKRKFQRCFTRNMMNNKKKKMILIGISIWTALLILYEFLLHETP